MQKIINKYFEWNEKRFARGITKAMFRSYKSFKYAFPNLDEREIIKKTLSTRPGIPAEELYTSMNDNSFWEKTVLKSLTEVIYLLVCMEYAEYMKGDIDVYDNITKKTFDVFKKTIIDIVNNSI